MERREGEPPARERQGEGSDVRRLRYMDGSSRRMESADLVWRLKRLGASVDFHDSCLSVGRVKTYNIIENVHQALLLSLVDLIIGKSEYPPN